MSRQDPGEVIDIATWRADEDFPIYPVGSKPKKLVISPDNPGRSFIRAEQGYLFKEARGWKAALMWSEVIAYEFSKLIGLDVPPAFIAIDSVAEQTGALIELFYPYPTSQKTIRLVHAADFMQQTFANGRKGRPHALRENLAVCRLLKTPGSIVWWAQAILFDTLIGNTDRHSENWGFLISLSGTEQTAILAPLYDNGTSLGYGIQDGKLEPTWDSARLAEFIDRGTHDIGWSRDEDGPTPHLALCERFFASFPSCKVIASKVLSFTNEQIEEMMDWAASFDLPLSFSPQRGRFIFQQLTTRRDRLIEMIGI